jgi:hypothetical protein
MRRAAAGTAPEPATRRPGERSTGRVTRAVAATVALTLGGGLLLAGCGHHDADAKSGKSPHATAHATKAPASGTTGPSGGALAAVALTTGDVTGIPGLRGYVSVAPQQGDDLSASGTSEALPQSCQPLAGLLDGVPPGKPTATTSRNIVARKSGLKAASFEIDLANYPGGAAHTAFGELSGSLGGCGKFAGRTARAPSRSPRPGTPRRRRAATSRWTCGSPRPPAISSTGCASGSSGSAARSP